MAGSNRDYDEREDLQVYDTGDDQDGEGSSLLMAIVISLLVLAALGCVVWIAYNNGVAHGHRDVAMQAMSAAKETPLATSDIPQSKSQAKAEEGDGAAPSASSAPAPQAPVAAAPAPAQTAAAAPAITQGQNVASAPVAKAVPQATKDPAQLSPGRPLSQVAQQAAPQATKPPARLQPPTVAPAPKVTKAEPVKKAEVKPVETKPAAKAVEKSASAKPVAEKPVAKSAGSYMLQIGAYKSEAEATSAWKAYKGKHAAVLGGASPDIQKAELGDKGTWYRLRAGPFASKDAAAAQCDKLKADGGSCFPAK